MKPFAVLLVLSSAASNAAVVGLPPESRGGDDAPWVAAAVADELPAGSGPLMVAGPALYAWLLTAQAVEPSPFRHGVSADDAKALAGKLETIERRRSRGRAPRDVVITERELNSYLNLGTPPPLPPELTDVEFRLERERIAARGFVDLDRLQGKVKTTGWNPLALLGGRVAVELKGRLATADGYGTVEVEEARLGGLSLPISILQQLVAAATRTSDKPEGFDLRSPFRLPYSAKRLRFEPGRMEVEF